MELETCRAIATALADPTIGMNAQIATLVMDQGGDQRPSNVGIYNYFDDDWVAKRVLNIDEARAGNIVLPCVAVYLDRPPTYDPEVQTFYRDGVFPVAVSWFSISSDEVMKRRQASMINRAVLRVFTQFNSNANTAMRFRNNVNLFVAKSIDQYTPNEAWGEIILAAQTLITYRVREHLP